MLGSTYSNSEKWPKDFLYFSQTYYFFVELVFFQVNISLYLYPWGYVSWKDTYGELVIFFIKRLTNIETSSTFLNNHQKILQKILENSRKFKISKFHLENSRTWIFTLWNYILQTQTSLLQPIRIYIYIYNNPPLGCNNICLIWLISYHA